MTKADEIHIKPRQLSELEVHAAIQAATYPQRELPDPLWPGHVLEEIQLTEPKCNVSRADELRRESHVAAYGAGLTERDVYCRREKPKDGAFSAWVAFALGGIVAGACALIIFSKDALKVLGVV